MSRRNQSRRRRSYGRRQHEVRERAPEVRNGDGWLSDSSAEFDAEWRSADSYDDRATYGESFGSFSR
jgi:hypothetical protein